MEYLSKYFEILGAGDAGQLAALFSREPLLDDPRLGHVSGNEALASFLAEYPAWVDGGHAELLALTDTPERTVAEFVMHLVRDGSQVPLPVALAADREGEGYAAIRVYYSMWPLLDHHVLRPPLLEKDEALVMPDAVGKYHDALTRGDLEAIMSVFEDDGYAREPSGGEYVYQGKTKLREFYGMLFTNDGGILLDHCTYTDDGVRGALEYNAISWGKTPMPPQAGIAVYERGKSGLLHAARIYDDVDPPV